MITTDLATAQILMLLVTDDKRQTRTLTEDLHRSRYRYSLASFSGSAAKTQWLREKIDSNDGRLPIVLLINDKFVGRDCRSLLQLAREAGKKTAIQCIVTHPPQAPSRRQELVALGARLFDSEDAARADELLLH